MGLMVPLALLRRERDERRERPLSLALCGAAGVVGVESVNESRKKGETNWTYLLSYEI
jgi:hypothetical protein